MGRLTQTLNSPWMGITESTRARFESSGQALLDSSTTGWLNANAGVRVERTTDGSKIGARVSTQFSGGGNDIRAADAGIGMFHNLSYVSVDAERKLNPRWTAILDSAVGFRHFGPQIMTAAGIRDSDSKTTVKAGYEGALRSDVPTILPGMAPKLFVDAETEARGWKLSATYLQPLDRAGRKNPTVRGSATKTFKK